MGPHEHHSNILPWRDAGATVLRVAQGGHGSVCLQDLRAQLARNHAAPLLIGAFSAASNVTGILADVDAVTALLHMHSALAIWDYATAG